MRIPALATALSILILALAGCGPPSYQRGVMDIRVMNEGEGSISGVRVEHGLVNWNYGSLAPAERGGYRFPIDPTADIVLRYITDQGVLKENNYEVRALPEHGGVVEMHVDRNGETRVTSRFFLY